MYNLNIKRFRPKEMESRRVHPDKGPPTIVLVGGRGTGKTYLVRDLMYYFRRIPAGMIITGSEASTEAFSEFFPKSFIFDDIDLERIENVVSNQRKLRKKKTEGDYSSLLLFDDCGFDKSMVKKKIIKGIFMNGRNWKILLIMTIQYCKDIPPDLRANVDYVFILREPNMEVRKKLWKEYAGIIPTFDAFNEAMNVCTEDRGALVIDKTSTSNKIEENVFWYRAHSPQRNYKVGSKELWKFHKDNYRSEDEDEEKSLDKQPKSSVVVKKVKKKKKKKNKSLPQIKKET